MSSGRMCVCPKYKDHSERKNWRVTQYHGNHSAFNGYCQTFSDYSDVHCTKCDQFWRTKAAYVDDLPKEDAP